MLEIFAAADEIIERRGLFCPPFVRALSAMVLPRVHQMTSLTYDVTPDWANRHFILSITEKTLKIKVI